MYVAHQSIELLSALNDKQILLKQSSKTAFVAFRLRIGSGRVFHAVGPATKKSRRLYALSGCRGTHRVDSERRCLSDAVLESGTREFGDNSDNGGPCQEMRAILDAITIPCIWYNTDFSCRRSRPHERSF